MVADYPAALAHIRRRRRQSVWVYVLFLPVMWSGMIVFAIWRPEGHLGGLVLLSLAVIGVGALGAWTIWLFRTQCPRCRHSFFMGWWIHSPFSCRCVHCGLSLAEP